MESELDDINGQLREEKELKESILWESSIISGNAIIATVFMDRYVKGEPLTSVHRYRVSRLTSSLRSDIQACSSSNSTKMPFARLFLKRDEICRPVFDSMHLSKLDLLMKTDCMKERVAELEIPDADVTIPRNLRAALDKARQKKSVDRERMMASGRKKMWGKSSAAPKKGANETELEDRKRKGSLAEKQNREEI